MHAYDFDSEFIIYAKADRLKALEWIADNKIGVSKKIEGCINMPRELGVKHLYIFDQNERCLKPYKYSNVPTAHSFYKYLVLTKKDKTCLVLYNTDYSYNETELHFELCLNIPDIYESMRLIESSAIDLELDIKLKNDYNVGSRTIYPAD